MHKRQFKSSSLLSNGRPLPPLAKPGGNLGRKKNHRGMIIIGGMGRKKENRAGGEKREGRGEGEKNDRRRACKGEREGSGKGTRSKMLRWSATERSAKASFPVHFLTTITFM